jgi:hypothetical protein
MNTTLCAVAPRPSHLCPIIAAEYAEMPGLNLTLAQAARLWKTDLRICLDALDSLVASGVLARCGERYVRADSRWVGGV